MASARHLDLRNDLSELDRLGAFARALGEAEGLDSDKAFALELCLEEAVANIIMHGGSPTGQATQISVSVLSGAPNLTLCLEDDGHPFDPTSAPVPETPASLEEAPIGGLGIPLIRKLAQGMAYERHAGRNRLILSFASGAAAPL